MYQLVIVEHGKQLCQKHEQLYVLGEREHHVPIEDISVLLLSHPRMTISAKTLVSLAEHGSTTILCDDTHLPQAVVLPLVAHVRRLKMLQLQVGQSKPKIKRLWQQIVQQKIRNQGMCLQFMGKEDIVSPLAKQVKSGDTTNVEAVAAALYFRTLFGNDFVRRDEDDVNGGLNYGYAIFRSALARYIALYGLEPAWGLFHHNELNPFNLADDLIEPFRPIVDLFVAICMEEGTHTMSTSLRRRLVQLLSCDVMSGTERHAAGYAMERTVQSLVRAFSGKDEILMLPRLLPWQIHQYE